MKVEEINEVNVTKEVMKAMDEPFLKIFEPIPKEMYNKKYSEVLGLYKPFDVNFFVNKTLKSNNKFIFYIKKYKYFIPFLFRKDRKLNFTYYVVRKSKTIKHIQAINKILRNI